MKFTNQQAVSLVNIARKQSKHLQSVMMHELELSGNVHLLGAHSSDFFIKSNAEVAKFLRAVADGLESTDEPLQR